MKRILLLGLSAFLIIASLILAACSQTSTTPLVSSTTQSQTITPGTTPSPPTISSPSTVSTTQANWWDSLGTPTYGGTMNVRASDLSTISIDPGNPMGGQYALFLERLFTNSWTVNPKEWNFAAGFTPPQYWQGELAASWEQTNPTTILVHLRQGIHWQNNPPVNGREVTADDVVYNYDRILGTGDGFTQPNAMMASWIPFTKQVTKVDKYTVQFNFNQPGAADVFDLMGASGGIQIGAPEWIKQYGSSMGGGPGGPGGPSSAPAVDWKTAVGTGPWILSNYVPGSSLTLTRNPGYYGHDERYPQNQLPYLDSLNFIGIPDMSTALAALRTGKIDVMNDAASNPSISEAAQLTKTNPEILQYWEYGEGPTLSMRVDKTPFTDIRVREALQMSLDLPTIAKSHYGGKVDGTPSGVVNPQLTGWCAPYSQWPSDLQQQYSYNPAQAKQLLADAGYQNGFKTDVVANGGEDIELLQIMQASFKDIGVQMDINMMDMPTMMPYIFAGKQDQMVYFRFSPHAGTPWGGISVFTTGNNLNFSKVADPDFDALYNKIIGADTMADAQKASAEADLYALKQHWTINTFPIPQVMPMQPWIKGYSSGEGLTDFEFARLWLDQSMQQNSGQ